MDIISDISNLKEKINNEIESLRYYHELSYLCDTLQKEVNNYEYDVNNNYSLRKYKAFLEVFLENKIGYINNLIVNKSNNSVFDNASELDYQKLKEIKKEISDLLSYIEDNFPIIGKEVLQEYNDINSQFNEELDNTSNYFKKKFDRDIGGAHDYTLSFYGDTSSVLKSYINHLIAFKAIRVDNIKIFVDNDIKVKELFNRAYETLKEPKVIEAVKQLESNYTNEINKCVESLSANTNILLIQENMIKNGLQLDKIIDMEKEKNNIYNSIINITLNYNNIDELLTIENYVIKNNLFQEEFYKVLYALVEKEKYVYVMYKHKPSIYDKISDKSKIILEKMFLERIKDLDDYQKEEIVINLKKNGYLNILDQEYKNFFDNSDFIIKTTYNKELIENTNNLQCEYIKKGIQEAHYDIVNKNTNKRVDRIYAINRDIRTFEKIGNIYRFSGVKINSFRSKDVDYYYDDNGRKIKPIKDKMIITQKVLSGYLAEDKDNKIILDSNYNKIMDYRGKDIHKEMLIDYKNENVLIFDVNTKIFSLYDKNYKLLKEIPLASVIDIDGAISLNEKMNMFNDGIVSILINDLKDKYICYYDVLNMKRIDLFKIPNEASLFGYSEGLYPCYTDNSKYYLGYKNLAGELVLKPKYLQAHPFINGCAEVTEESSVDHGFINYQGIYTNNGSLIGYDTTIIKLNLPLYRYEVTYAYNNKKYIICAKHIYNIDNEDKIIDIDFKNKDKVKKKMA